ncbi:MAG: hypothetical protein VCE75_10455 [Alphaproteobacteria bacterium]
MILSAHFVEKLPERIGFVNAAAETVTSIIEQIARAVEHGDPMRGYRGHQNRKVFPAKIQFFAVVDGHETFETRDVMILTTADSATAITILSPTFVTKAAIGKAICQGKLTHADN